MIRLCRGYCKDDMSPLLWYAYWVLHGDQYRCLFRECSAAENAESASWYGCKDEVSACPNYPSDWLGGSTLKSN